MQLSACKRALQLLCIFICFLLLFGSCAATKPFASGPAIDSNIPLEEKFELYGGIKVKADYPQMYFDGTQWLQELTGLVDQAEDYIFISAYLGSSCEGLDDFYEKICEKAESGVRVYYYIDASSFYETTEAKNYMFPLYFLRDRSVNLVVYNPFTVMHVFKPESYFFRDHRKIVVVDGKCAAIGGMNTEYASIGAGEKNNRDSMYLFRSPSVIKALRDLFVKSWNESSVEKINADDFEIAMAPDGLETYNAWLFSSDMLENKVSIAGLYSSLFNEAKSSIKIFTILPVFDSRMFESLKQASQRGVDTDFYFNIANNTFKSNTQALNYELDGLVSEAGVDVFDTSYKPDGSFYPFFHLKLMTVDDRYAVLGSANFNFRSMALSNELCLVVDCKQLAVEAFEKSMEVAGELVEITPEQAEELKSKEGSLLGWIFTFIGG